MKIRLIKLIPALLLSLLSICLVVNPAGAIGLGVGPSVLTIQNAAPGQDYTKTIFVYNTSAAEQVFLLTGSGDIAPWVTFYPLEDNSQPITQVSIPANGRAYSSVKFSVPADASPLVYRGQLLVTGEPPDAETGGAHVQVQLPIGVIIQMAGAPDVIPDTPTPTFIQTIRSGELNLMSLDFEGQPAVGQLTKMQASLKNLTGVNTTAYLIAEVYLGDKLIDTIKSDELAISGGADATLTAYYKPSQAGDYTIKGQVTYEGKQTEQKNLQLKVAGPDQSQGLPLMTIIGGSVGVVIVASVVLFLIYRRRGY
jgi:hypothetical protein